MRRNLIEANPPTPSASTTDRNQQVFNSAASTVCITRRPALIPPPVKRTNYEIHQLCTDIICLKKKKTEIESAVQAKKIQLQKTRSREAELKQTIKNCMRREKRHVAALRRIKLQLKNLQKDYRQVSESFLVQRAKTEQAKLQVHKLEETVSKLREKVVKLQKAASARTKTEEENPK